MASCGYTRINRPDPINFMPTCILRQTFIYYIYSTTMSVHIAGPYVTFAPYNGNFSVPTSTIFGLTTGSFVVDPRIVGGATVLSLTSTNTGTSNTPRNYYAVLWGSGGSGGASVAGNPVGDIIGGGGGAGSACIVEITLTAANQLAESCTISFQAAGGAATVTFTDTRATPATPGASTTATKTISTFAGRAGGSATYSVGDHAPGNGGSGGGQAVGQLPIDIGAAASAAFVGTAPAGFISWNFSEQFVGITAITYVGQNGVNGIRGAVGTNPLTFTLPVDPAQINIPRTLTAGLAPPGLAGGAGGAGCGSLSILTPGGGGTALVYVNAY